MHFKRINPAALSDKIPKNPLMRRSNPKLAEHSHEGESGVYNIPEFITLQSDTELLLQTEFEFRKVLQSSSAAEKINDSLATK